MAHENPAFSQTELTEEVGVLRPELALEVHDGWLTYGKKENTFGLKGVNLHVPRGHIYALLGPSACGKTTLLSSLVGIRSLKRGSIRIFGKSSGSSGSEIGYMPQELALYLELTAEETLSYFGRIHCMPEALKQKRSDHLLDLLEIPRGRRVNGLSGGQKRRLSLAVALIHEPPLLLLDEPTVGVDPLLRRTIWKHLKELTTGQSKTVVITTHYVEEARDAHSIGLMRDGRILLETKPEELISQFSVATLEEAFLHICIKEEQSNAENSSAHYSEEAQLAATHQKYETHIDASLTDDPTSTVKIGSCEDIAAKGFIFEEDALSNDSGSWATATNVEVSSALRYEEETVEIQCNSNQLEESKGKMEHVTEGQGTLADESNPTVTEMRKDRKSVECEAKNTSSSGTQETISNVLDEPRAHRGQQKRFCNFLPEGSRSAIANNVRVIYALIRKNSILMRRSIVMMVVLFALPIVNVCLTQTLWGHAPFDLPLAVVNSELSSLDSQRLFQQLDHHTLDVRHSSDYEDAVGRVTSGEAIGALHIPDSFFIDTMRRLRLGLSVDNETLLRSRLRLRMDGTNRVNSGQVFISLLKSAYNMAEDLEIVLATEPGALTLPLVFEKPVVGKPEPEMVDVYIMGLLPENIFLLSLAFSALVFLGERENGMFERNQVSGIKPLQLVLSHFVIHSAITSIQCGLLISMLAVIDMEIKGSRILLVLLLFLCSYQGMVTGIFVSSLTQNGSLALSLAFAITMVSCLTSGLMWPTESVPYWVRYICYCNPNLWTLQAFKLVITHGLGLAYYQIWSSVLISVGCISLVSRLCVTWLKKSPEDAVFFKTTG